MVVMVVCISFIKNISKKRTKLKYNEIFHCFRDHRQGSLQVDKEPMVTATSDSGATQLDTDGMLWIGTHHVIL